jgi:hypothetical protein
MSTTTPASESDRQRNLLFMTRPALWPQWPFLPLVRRRPGREDECGVLCDVLGLNGPAGHSATVHIANLFTLPGRLEEILALPKEVHDLPEGAIRSLEMAR